MKKIYLIFLFAACFTLPFLSNIDRRSNKFIYQNNVNNLEKIIDDSITPICKVNRNNLDNNLIQTNFIKVVIPESRNWSKNLINAYTSKSYTIQDKYKKRYDADIYIKFPKNTYCKLPAKVRLSGDWRDHIALDKNGNIISSIDVKLLRGNINGITNFKLFLPSTRNYSAEIIISSLLKEMGYLSPRSKMIEVNLNGQFIAMIFQEKAVKEMLENNNLRESAILESDESLLWKLRGLNNTANNNNIFPRVINTKWTKKSLINQKIGLEGINILSKAILESWNRGGTHNEITFSDLILSNQNFMSREILSRFKAHLVASGSIHALYNHNRRFYFDPITKSLLPIYYDGDSQIRNLKDIDVYDDNSKKSLLMRDIKDEDFDSAIEEIKIVDSEKFIHKLRSSGVKMEISELEIIKNNLIKNLTFLKAENQLKTQKTKFINNPLERDEFLNSNIEYGLIFHISEKDFFICDIKDKICQPIEINENEFNKLLAGEFEKDNVKYYFLGDQYDPQKNLYKNKRTLNAKIFSPYEGIFIRKFGNPLLKLGTKNKKIVVDINNFEDKILIFNSNLDNLEIVVNANIIKEKETSDSRIDSNLLTSLLTIKDSKLNDLKINISGGNHEDSLNIIKSYGSIDSINIENSFQDAIDFDFSDLDVNQINVINSGNDCIDVSAGKYFINESTLYGCKDKGISVGEGSTLKIKNAQISESNIALVSKDSSSLIIENGILNNNNFCVAAYNKKQEFGPSDISIPKDLCKQEEILIQNLSKLNIK